MDGVTRQNAALVEQAAAAAESMREQAGSLSTLVGTFKVKADVPDSAMAPVRARPEQAAGLRARPVLAA